MRRLEKTVNKYYNIKAIKFCSTNERWIAQRYQSINLFKFILNSPSIHWKLFNWHTGYNKWIVAL